MAEADGVEEIVGLVEAARASVAVVEHVTPRQAVSRIKGIHGPQFAKEAPLLVRALNEEFGVVVRGQAFVLLGRALSEEFGVVVRVEAFDLLDRALNNDFGREAQMGAVVVLERALTRDFGGVAQREARVLLGRALNEDFGIAVQIEARGFLVRALRNELGRVAQRQAHGLIRRALNESSDIITPDEACNLSTTVLAGVHSPAKERVSKLVLSLNGSAWEAFCEHVASLVAAMRNEGLVEWISSVEGKLSDAQREVAVRVAADMFVSWSLPSSTDTAMKTRVLKAVHRPLAGLKQGRTAFMQNLVKQTREARVAKPQSRAAPARS